MGQSVNQAAGKKTHQKETDLKAAAQHTCPDSGPGLNGHAQPIHAVCQSGLHKRQHRAWLVPGTCGTCRMCVVCRQQPLSTKTLVHVASQT